jgi:quercetin dioxygenase-like cupin family protein
VTARFPEFIAALPAPQSPVDMSAHIVPSEHVLTMFFEITDDVEIPEHAHGAQWGVVLDGELELTIDGVSLTYRRGDSYFVPDGSPHTARIKGGYAGIDVFADAHRYEPATRTRTDDD